MKDDLIKQEERNMRRLRFLVDLTEAVLVQSDLNLKEALDLIKNTKNAALSLFPDKESVYDLIYARRFQRIVEERFTIPGTFSGRN